MPLLPSVGRRTFSLRLAILCIYLFLVIGGLTMIFPFFITLTASLSNALDYERYDVLPSYLWKEEIRFAKYLAEKYAGIRFEHFAVAYGAPSHWSTFKDVGFDENLDDLLLGDLKDMPMESLSIIATDYQEFLEGYDPSNMIPLFYNWELEGYQAFLREKYETLVLEQEPYPSSKAELSERVLEQVSRTWNEGLFLYWDYIQFNQELLYPYHLRRWVPWDDPRHKDFLSYVRFLPASRKLPISGHYLWCLFLLDQGVQVDLIDQRYGTSFQSIYRIPPGDTTELPQDLQDLWLHFQSEVWPLRLTRIVQDDNLEPTRMDPILHQHPTLPEASELRRLWVELAQSLDSSRRICLSPEDAYRAFLRHRYPDLSELNRSYGWSRASWQEILLPLREVDYHDYVHRRGEILRRLLSFNFIKVARFIAVRGRALPNTLILVVSTVLCTLTVNPLAAYALSRFRLKATRQILVYLLATMAFPPEVGMIPGFLLLRDLHLLNTFPALILPGVANGFSIFLLKGFFDSLPQELYEAASLDGASEIRMFFTITMTLSAPILSVIALNAFIMSYGSFMWAFLVCQDPKMWTLMVWLYQFQTTNQEPWLVMAAIVLASIPTLLVFIFCQKIILRGIVIPSMK